MSRCFTYNTAVLRVDHRLDFALARYTPLLVLTGSRRVFIGGSMEQNWRVVAVDELSALSHATHTVMHSPVWKHRRVSDVYLAMKLKSHLVKNYWSVLLLREWLMSAVGKINGVSLDTESYHLPCPPCLLPQCWHCHIRCHGPYLLKETWCFRFAEENSIRITGIKCNVCSVNEVRRLEIAELSWKLLLVIKLQYKKYHACILLVIVRLEWHVVSEIKVMSTLTTHHSHRCGMHCYYDHEWLVNPMHIKSRSMNGHIVPWWLCVPYKW